MENIQKSIYIKLNELVEAELEKDKPDTKLINECVDGMLRLMPESSYQITKEQREENIQRIFEMLPKSNTNTRIIKVLVAAAIILILLIGTVFAYTVVEYKIHDYRTYSEVWANIVPRRVDDPVEVGYVPEGFELAYEDDNKVCSYKEYKSEDEEIVIDKTNYRLENINTEYGHVNKINIDGVEYIIYGEEKHGKGITWFTSNYSYSVSGTSLTDEELLKIAQSAH